MNETARNTWFISMYVKLLVGFTLLFTIVFAVAFYWFYNFASDQAGRRIVEDMVDTMMGAAENIDGDEMIALYHEGEVREDGYTDDPRYWKHVAWLAKVEEIEPRASLYTYVRGEGEYEIVYIGSSWAVRDPPEGVTFLLPYTSKGSSWKGLEETTLKLEDENGNFGYHDEYGYWISGRTPIFNNKGEKVGALGIDFEADYVLEVQQAIRDRMVLAFGITYATLFTLVLLISRALSRPIVVLTQAAERIGEGDYEQDLSRLRKGRLRDEISTLAEVFEVMVSKVREREQTLRRQVQELTIEINQVRLAKHVGEIVESEFFQDLRSKARHMRSAHREDSEHAQADDASDDVAEDTSE
ncbi:MAG: HAMP domain-containing protein [Anaerolineae bacterium]|nr:HAMP domain-containing protein [Anaerolineae bacterium]